MGERVGAPGGAEGARQGGGVARIVLAAVVAVGLMGCDVRQQMMTDDAGCKWAVLLEEHGDSWIIIRGDKVLNSDGKPMCGAP